MIQNNGLLIQKKDLLIQLFHYLTIKNNFLIQKMKIWINKSQL